MALFDVLITHGRVVDGTGAPWRRADVGIVGDRIQAVGDLSDASATQRIDASDHVVAPGFIDMLGQSEANVLVDPRLPSKVMQGITTEVTGEGQSIAPHTARTAQDTKWVDLGLGTRHLFPRLRDYFDHLDQEVHPALNLASFAGLGTLRNLAMGMEDRAATPSELQEMKRLLAEAMTDGALGLSAALQYLPDRFAPTEEIVELVRVAGAHGGLYITHQRSEGDRIDESLTEVFHIAERTGTPVEIWHLKVAFRDNWGRMGHVLARLEAARGRGLDVTANVYPYNRASNWIDSCLPTWAREGGAEALRTRLQDPAARERIKQEMEQPATTWENQWYGSGGAEGVMLASVITADAYRKFEGKSFAEIGHLLNQDPREVVMDITLADRAQSWVIISIMDEQDMLQAVQHPLLSFCTDSPAQGEDGPFSVSKAHPRAWGTFPRILGRYVRDTPLLTLEEAIRRATSRPASRVGLFDRGMVRPGMAADLVVFDPARIQDRSTYDDPSHYSVGMTHVLVNGQPVVRDGCITDARPGRALKGPGHTTR